MSSLSVEACLHRIGRLPQAAVIDPERATRWVRQTMGIDGARIAWHIARAGGIGGSEAGTIVSWGYGEFATRTTASRLAKGKLLILPPDRSNDDMARGARLEAHVQEVFEEKLTREGRRWRRRDDIKRTVEASPHPDYPWLRASLDGVYEIDGAIVIVDFKAPSEESLAAYVRHRDFHDYRAQLNHYDLVADGHGVRVDGLILAMYDYRRVASVGVQTFGIERDATLQQQIINASSAFWHDYVLKGALPAETRQRVLRANDGVPEEVQAIARRAIVNKMIADKAAKDYEADQEAIARWVAETGVIGDGVLALGSFAAGAEGFLQVKAKPVLDRDRAIARLRELGKTDADIEALRGPDKHDAKKLVKAFDERTRLLEELVAAVRAGAVPPKLLDSVDKALRKTPIKEKADYDEEKIVAALDSCLEDRYSFLTEKISSGLPRGKRLDLEERRAAVGTEVEILVGSLAASPEAPGEEDLPEGPAPSL